MENILTCSNLLIKDYDGRDFPDIINTILRENLGGVIFGGSSVIHDLYFKEENWDRDYDIWCLSSNYAKIKTELIVKWRCDNIKTEKYKRLEYYEIFNPKEISEYNYKTEELKIKIQLINIGTLITTFTDMITNIDLTFNTVFYDGLKLFYFRTTEERVKAREGEYEIFIHFNAEDCFCNRCMKDQYENINKRQITRIQKYRERGFHITNLCPLCDTPAKLSIFHVFNCIKKKLGLELKDSIESKFYLIGGKIDEERLHQLIKYGESDNSYMVISSLLLILSTRRIDLFMEKLEEWKEKITVDGKNVLYSVFKIGSEIAFRKFNEIYRLNSKKLEKLFLFSCKRKYLNLARYISSLSSRLRLDIQEDTIVEYKILNIFDAYLNTNDESEILTEFNKIKKIEDNEDCPICKYRVCNIEIGCRHKFCMNCLMLYFSIKTTNQQSLNCPICRQKFYN